MSSDDGSNVSHPGKERGCQKGSVCRHEKNQMMEGSARQARDSFFALSLAGSN